MDDRGRTRHGNTKQGKAEQLDDKLAGMGPDKGKWMIQMIQVGKVWRC
jgi:hypothetical protein